MEELAILGAWPTTLASSTGQVVPGLRSKLEDVSGKH